MSLYTAVKAFIDNNVRNKTPLVVKVELADTLQAMLDDGYFNATENQTNQIYTTKSGTSITYTLTIVKSNGIATANVTIANTTGSNIAPGTAVFTWKSLVGGLANELTPIAGFTAKGRGFDVGNNTDYSVQFQMTPTGMTLLTGMAAGYTYNCDTITWATNKN